MPGLIKNKALGLIETVGLVGAIEACDAASKAADVIVSAAEIVDPALVTIKIFGELGAVQSAVDAGSAAAAKIGQLLSSHIIPNPDSELEVIMGEAFKPAPVKTPTQKDRSPKPKSPKNIKPESSSKPGVNIDMARLENMRVTELRNFARTIPNLGIRGREISRADKETLLYEIRKVQGS